MLPFELSPTKIGSLNQAHSSSSNKADYTVRLYNSCANRADVLINSADAGKAEASCHTSGAVEVGAVLGAYAAATQGD